MHWTILFVAAVALVTAVAHSQPIETYPYLETFDGFATCGECPNDGECLGIGDWTQEQGAGLNWAVADYVLAGCGSGPATGDHTTGSGNYMWVHQGETDVCESSSVEGIGCSSFFFDEQIGLISPQFSFADVPEDTGINLRYFTYLSGLRTGSMSVWASTEGASGPWTELHRAMASEDSWVPQTVSLSAYHGAPSVHLRFLAEMLPDSGEISFSNRPDPDALADQALDDVNIFLGNASAAGAGSEDRAVWVDLSRRFGISGSLLNDQHTGGWFGAPREMLTFGGLDQLGAFVKEIRVFDYATKEWDEGIELTDTDPLARRRVAATSNVGETALFVYGGSEFTGPVPSVLWLSYQDRSIRQLACAKSDPGDSDINHAQFPAEGATAVLSDTGDFLVFGGRGIVVQLNFITRYAVDEATDNCTYAPLRATSGPPPPRSRWGHVAAFWRDPATDVGYMFGHGGRFQPSSSDTPILLGDVFIFDFATEEWVDLRVLDPLEQPAPRAFHSAVKNRAGDKLVVYGGLDDTDPSNTIYYSDAFVLTFDSEFVIWKRLAPTGDPALARARHSMVPLFFPDTTLGANTDNEEGYLVFGGTTLGGSATNNVARLNFGALDLDPLPEDGGDDGDPTVAIVLGVILPFCCLLLLLLLLLATLVAAVLTWRAMVKRRIRKKYGVGQDTPMTDIDDDDNAEQN